MAVRERPWEKLNRDRTMAWRHTGRAWHGRRIWKKKSKKEKGTWPLTATELSYCPNADDFWDGLAWAFFSPLPA